MKFSYTVFLIIFLSSCTRQSDVSIKSFDAFPEEISLIAQEIKSPPKLFQIVGMEMTDDALITLDFKGNEFFQVFSLPNLDYVGGFVNKGRGPGEESVVYPYFKHTTKNNFLYQTMTSLKTMEYNKEDKTVQLKEKVDLPSQLMNLIQVFKIEENFYGWQMNQKGNNEFIGYDQKNKSSFDFGTDYPKVSIDIPSSQKSAFFDRTSVVKPDNSKFATVYNKFPILRIYSGQGNLLSESRFKNNQEPPSVLLDENPSIARLNGIMQNYKKVKATNNHIYALYCGKTNQEMNLTGEGVGLNDFSNEIHVWNWNGKPIKKIILDKECFSFCVSPNDEYLITSSLSSIDTLYKYKIDLNEK